MIYTNVKVIFGICITKKQLLKSGFKFTRRYQGLPGDNEYALAITPSLELDLRVFSWPECCTGCISGEYLVGVALHTHYKIYKKKCKQCPPPETLPSFLRLGGCKSECDDCLSATNAGHVDIWKMVDVARKLDRRQVCRNCYGLVVNFSKGCKVCKAPAKESFEIPNEIVDDIVKALSDKDLPTELSFYSWMNGCDEKH